MSGVNITFQVESLEAVIDSLRALMRAHWREIAVFKDEIHLNVDFGVYERRAQEGALHIVTVRADGGVVGYYVSFIGPHPHYSQYKMAFLDSYFVLPEFRRAMVGIGLFEEMERSVRELGCKAMISATKRHHDVGPLFAHLGWSEIGRQYMKVL